MAESITAVKDYKASPSLGKETIYKNWKKFMTLIEKSKRSNFEYGQRSPNCSNSLRTC